MNTPLCPVEGCDRPIHCKGYCVKHYVRWRKYGDPLLDFTHAPRARAEPAIRFWQRVDKSGGDDACWPWTASKRHAGHGQFGVAKGKVVLAHRFAYAETYGPIPDGHDVHHKCHNPACCNPKHLEAVPLAEHRRQTGAAAQHADQTHCISGHPLSGENVYMWRGERHCRICRRDRNRAAYHAKPHLPHPRDRTHCPQGHPYDEQNTKVYQGHRYCRACLRQRGK